MPHGDADARDAAARLHTLAEHWAVQFERVTATPTSLLAFGTRGDAGVVLKVIRTGADEWHTGAVTAAFRGHGVVRVYEHVPGAVLLERITPAPPLAELVRAGRDDEATIILARVIRTMQVTAPPVTGATTAAAWGAAFDSYAATADNSIPPELVARARALFGQLCHTQESVRLLHGDLQHDNILEDGARGWLAIDPKGVVAELEFELGPALRNPHGMPELYDTAGAQRRIAALAAALPVNVPRLIAWSFSQAVLSAIWSVEDNGAVAPGDPALLLAAALRPLLE